MAHHAVGARFNQQCAPHAYKLSPHLVLGSCADIGGPARHSVLHTRRSALPEIVQHCELGPDGRYATPIWLIMAAHVALAAPPATPNRSRKLDEAFLGQVCVPCRIVFFLQRIQYLVLQNLHHRKQLIRTDLMNQRTLHHDAHKASNRGFP